MNLDTLLEKLSACYSRALSLLEKAGYDLDNECFNALEWDKNDMDAFVPVKVLERLAPSLYEQNNRLEMAKYEPDRHAYRLRRMPSGRFGYYREDGRLEEMWCGRQIEALIDVDGRPYWVTCSIEFENKDYYVTRYYVPMDGLLVREPRGKEIYGIW